jgi:hypothetical protein
MSQQSKQVVVDEKSFEAREPAPELGAKEEAELRLKNLYERIDEGRWGLRSEHLRRLIKKVELGRQPTDKEKALWGTDRPILTFGNETMYVYEGFRTENIDRDHAVAHETSEAIMASGLFKGTNWKEVTGQLNQGALEDTGYVRGIRNELENLKDPTVLAEKAREAKMDPEVYRAWMQRRVPHEQFAEALTFYLRSGGDEQEMLALHMEHVSKDSLPPEWQEALDNGDKAEIARLYKESGVEERNHYFYDLFDKTFGQKSPDDITGELNTIDEIRKKRLEGEEQELEDEEYDELMALELEEQFFGVQEAPAVAQPPKIKKEPSLWDMLKGLFSPKPQTETPRNFF